MSLASQMVLLRKCTLKVLGTFYAVKFPKARPVFIGNQGFMLFELAGIAEVGVDLVNITVTEVSATGTGRKQRRAHRSRRLVLERRMAPIANDVYRGSKWTG